MIDITNQPVYKNTSGKYLQFPLRLSGNFKWSPNERIKVLHEQKETGGKSGYIVFNMDYVGHKRCYETAWIDEETLLTNFTKE